MVDYQAIADNFDVEIRASLDDVMASVTFENADAFKAVERVLDKASTELSIALDDIASESYGATVDKVYDILSDNPEFVNFNAPGDTAIYFTDNINGVSIRIEVEEV